MGFIEKLTKKITKTAATTVSDTVKSEAKSALADAVPVLLSVGGFLIGAIAAIRGSKSNGRGHHWDGLPDATNVHVTTNNYFLNPDMNDEFIKELIDR